MFLFTIAMILLESLFALMLDFTYLYVARSDGNRDLLINIPSSDLAKSYYDTAYGLSKRCLARCGHAITGFPHNRNYHLQTVHLGPTSVSDNTSYHKNSRSRYICNLNHLSFVNVFGFIVGIKCRFNQVST